MEAPIRAATVNDIDAVLRLWKEADAEPSRTDDTAGIRALLDYDAEALLLAELDDQLVGSVIAGWDGWRGSIYRLVVHPQHRRRGIARRLLLEAEKRTAERGARRLQAIVVSADSPATAFWQASDWNEQVARVRFVKG